MTIGETSGLRAQIEATLGEWPKGSVSKKSAASYRRLFMNLAKKSGGVPADTLKLAAQTRSPRTWYFRRAALVWGCRETLLEANALLKSARASQVREDTINFCLHVLDSVPDWCPIPKEERKRRSSKRQSLRGLPKNWREQVPRRLAAHHLAAYHVCALTGCRPVELEKGVRLELVNGLLVITIDGGKVTLYSGQPIRIQEWPIDSGDRLIQNVVDLACGGPRTVSVASGKAFSRAIADAGRRLWPKRASTITAYSLRHARSSDLKAAGYKGADVSAFLGHVVTKTKSGYGASRQGSPNAVGPKRISASRPVRDNTRKIPSARFRRPDPA